MLQALIAGFCQLSIASNTSGTLNDCSAVLISPTKILTAAHCFGADFDLKSSVVIAECGSEVRDSFSHLQLKNGSLIGPASEDLAILSVDSAFSSPSFLSPTEYPGMYFESGSRLKPTVSCRVLGKGGRSFSYSADVEIQLAPDPRTHKSIIRVQSKSGAPLTTTTIPGDSGGALLCRPSAQMHEELIGIVSSRNEDNKTRLPMRNFFCPVFSEDSQVFLKTTK